MRIAGMIVVGALAGCSGEDGVGLDGTPPAMTADCTGAQEYVAGVSATTPLGRTVAILDANPAPPDVGDNTWTVEVTDGSAPVSGLQLSITPWMPLHGHGVSPANYASADQGDGTYEIDTFDLIMPGTWEFTVDAGVADGLPDEVVFSFCAEG